MSWILKKVTKEQLTNLVSKATSYAQVSKALGLKGGGSHSGLKKLIEKHGLDVSHFKGKSWNKGLTKFDHFSISEAARKSSEKMKGRSGRSHTKETRQKMSKSASERSWRNGLVKTKWYEVFCPYLDLTINVQGTWELKYVQWLNENRIRWTKDTKISFPWRKFPEDIERRYHPDFLLIDSHEFIEIKGFMWKNEKKNVDDALKLKLVQEQNPNLKLRILMKNDLVEMGVLV